VTIYAADLIFATLMGEQAPLDFGLRHYRRR
jgi:hypothetical protein